MIEGLICELKQNGLVELEDVSKLWFELSTSPLCMSAKKVAKKITKKTAKKSAKKTAKKRPAGKPAKEVLAARPTKGKLPISEISERTVTMLSLEWNVPRHGIRLSSRLSAPPLNGNSTQLRALEVPITEYFSDVGCRVRSSDLAALVNRDVRSLVEVIIKGISGDGVKSRDGDWAHPQPGRLVRRPMKDKKPARKSPGKVKKELPEELVLPQLKVRLKPEAFPASIFAPARKAEARAGTAAGGAVLTASAVFGLCEPGEGEKSRSVDPAKLLSRQGSELPNMDQRLQLAAARARQGYGRAETSSTAGDELPVVAIVSDFQAWERIGEVRMSTLIVGLPDGSSIVTARVPVTRIEKVRGEPCVLSMKASQVVKPTLDASTLETACRKNLLPSTANPAGGQGVVVGVIDFGCDFAHWNFRNEDGSTRIEAIWSQAGDRRAEDGVGYGRLHRRAEINDALAADDPYATLDYEPSRDPLGGPIGTHGTHVMDIAAGNGRGSGVPGYAPAADLIFVDLSTENPWQGKDAVGDSFGDSVHLLEALKFIFREAGDRPCVVNLSLGTNGGPHDGTSPMERGIDELVREKDNRAVVIAASNSYADGIHTTGKCLAGGSVEIPWVLKGQAAEMEIWLEKDARAAVELVSPSGISLGIIEPGEAKDYQEKEGGPLAAYIANGVAKSTNDGNFIGIFVSSEFEASTWTVKLHLRSAADAVYHGWVERYDRAQANFGTAADPGYTLGSISCGHESIVVGAYDARKPDQALAYFSSAGPTRDGREKPEVSAPGYGVWAARSRTGTRTVTKNGTSMASPAVSGLVALIYAEARRQGKSLGIQALRKLLQDAARKSPPVGASWDPRYGHGRVSGAALKNV